MNWEWEYKFVFLKWFLSIDQWLPLLVYHSSSKLAGFGERANVLTNNPKATKLSLYLAVSSTTEHFQLEVARNRGFKFSEKSKVKVMSSLGTMLMMHLSENPN